MEEVMTDINGIIVKKEKKKRNQHHMVIINEEELIRQVEIRPVLYDKSLRGYRKSTMRDQSWKEIASLLHSTVEECRKRWRSLRDAFARHHKHMSEEDPSMSKKKKWLYYDQMYFLAPYLECSGYDLPPDSTNQYSINSINLSHSPIQHSTAITTLQDNSQETIIMEGEEQIEEIHQNCAFKSDEGSSEHNENNHQQNDHQQADTEQAIDLYENQVMTRLFASPATYQITDCKPSKSDTTTETYAAIATTDPDERFLLSCSPILKRLPTKKNALARLKIQQILYNIEFGES